MPPIPVSPPHIYPPAIVAALNIQTGQATLAAGTVTVTGVTLTPGSVIDINRITAAGTAGAGGLVAPLANRTQGTGTGSFVIRAVDLAGTLVTTDTSLVEWKIVG